MTRSITRNVLFPSILVCLVLPTLTASAARPKVVETTPGKGDTNVDPKLRQIRVVFDQPMSRRGYSVVGGGVTFPKITRKLHWVSATTCVFGVQLKPNHKYWLSINSNKFTNFRNAKWQPAVPYVVSFTTGPRSGASQPETKVTPAANRAAVEALREAIENKYSYRDLRGVNWNEQFASHSEAMAQASTAAAFAREAAKLLAAAQDPHIWLEVNDQTIGTFRRSVEPNVHKASLAKVVSGIRQHNDVVKTARLANGITYISINSWPGGDPESVIPVYEALWAAEQDKGVIIDVRANGGGAEPLARQVAACFIDKKVLYAKHDFREPGAPSGLGRIHERILQPNKVRPRFRGRVAVLTGPVVMSSCEAFLLMMKQAPNCRLIGASSYGSSGNPKPVELGNGVTVYLPSWRAMKPDETLFEGKGIAPDIKVQTTPEQIRKTDPVLDAAIKWLGT